MKKYSIEIKSWVGCATKFTYDEILDKRTANLIQPIEDVSSIIEDFFTPIQIFLENLISSEVKKKYWSCNLH